MGTPRSVVERLIHIISMNVEITYQDMPALPLRGSMER